MTLSPGSRLGPYEILTPIGAGGMGEVYRARDTKLNRGVAIKVLLPSVANDPDRLARFSREAQLLASLNHPNIAHIHGLEGSAIVMELVDGPTLADRIAQAPIALDEALAMARQIADALDCAHEHGIVHRDLKPANIKIAADGTIKVLDFGLAKAMDPTGTAGINAMNSPTLSMHGTQAGMILGTAAYMSPEQARGGPVDRRADIWAFGVVLFEMLTGGRAFGGGTISDTLASVLKAEPDWNALPSDTPRSIRRLLTLCLKKDPKARLRDIGEARRSIDEAIVGAIEDSPAAASRHRSSRWLAAVPWAIAALALVTSIVIARRIVDVAQPVSIYASIDAPADYVIGEDDALVPLPTRTPMAFTADGRSIVVQAARNGKPQLVLRPLDRPDLRPIAGTEDARVPFVSPDGKWIGFWSANELKKVPVEGGTPTTICAVPSTMGPNGAAWGPRDIIIFGDDASGRIMRVSASGGDTKPVTEQASPSTRKHVTPSFLPDGRRILYADVSLRDARDAQVMVQSLDGHDPRLLVRSATDPRVLPSGQLAFMRLGTLTAVPFDPSRGALTGEAVVAMGDVMQSGMLGRAGAINTGAGMFAVSTTGTLAVIRGGLTGATGNHLTWMTRDGRMTPADPASGTPNAARNYSRLSPDGTRAAVTIQTPIRRDVWIADWTRDSWTLCAECDSESSLAVWSPDGRRLILGRADTLVEHSIDAVAPDRILVREPGRSLTASTWRRDGTIVYSASEDFATYEIKVLAAGQRSGRTVVSSGPLGDADVSPDGRWMAYTAQQSGQRNVVVQAFPEPGLRVQVSAGRAMNPKWSPDGKTLYYIGPDASNRQQSLFAVAIDTTHGLLAGKPQPIGAPFMTQTCTVRCYDLTPDGQRFLLRTWSDHRASVTRIDVVLNWMSTLK